MGNGFSTGKPTFHNNPPVRDRLRQAHLLFRDQMREELEEMEMEDEAEIFQPDYRPPLGGIGQMSPTRPAIVPIHHHNDGVVNRRRDQRRQHIMDRNVPWYHPINLLIVLGALVILIRALFTRRI